MLKLQVPATQVGAQNEAIKELMESKRCKICQIDKPIDDFHRLRKWRASYCKPCQSKFAKQWRLQNIDKVKADKKRRYANCTPDDRWRHHLKMRYGITPEEYMLLHDQQAGVCAICSQPSQRLRLSVDHCHATGAIRGLLCERCNSILGRVKDDPAILETAAAYLRNIA